MVSIVFQPSCVVCTSGNVGSATTEDFSYDVVDTDGLFQ